MKISIGADHQGVKLQDKIYEDLLSKKYEVEKSMIPHNPTDDYPDYAFDVCEKVLKNKDALGILICGNGIGMSIAANKVKKIRCARVMNEDDAYKAKSHNAANVIALGAIDEQEAKKIVEKFITTEYTTVPRHLARIAKIEKYEG